MSIGRLIVEFEARTGKFETDTGRAAKIMEKRAREIDKQVKKIGVAVGAAVGAAVVGIGALIKKSIDAADEMDKLAQKTGLSIEAVSQLQYAAKLSGVEDLGASLTKFNKSVGDAAQGSKAQAAAFRELGVEIRNADGTLKDTETLFNATAEAISKLPDGIKKTQLAIDLFGKSGAQLIPFLNEGKAGLAAMRKEADDLGLTLDERTGKAADGFNDNLDRLQAVVQGVGTRLAVQLAPELERITGLFVQTAKDGNTVTDTADGMAAAFKGLALVAITLGNIVTGLTRAFVQGHLAQAAFFQGNFSQAFDELAIGSEGILKDIEDVQKAYDNLFGDAQALPARPKPRSGGDFIVDEEAQKERNKALKEAQAEAEKALQKSLEAEEKQRESIASVIDALKDESATMGLTNAQIQARTLEKLGATAAEKEQAYQLAKYIDLQKAAEEADKERAAVLKETRTYAEIYGDEIARLNVLFENGTRDSAIYNRAVAAAQDAFDKAEKAAEEAAGGMAVFADEAARNMQDSLADFLFDPFDKGLKGMVASFAQAMQRMAAEAAAAEILGSLTKGSGNIFSGLFSLGASFFSGGMSSSGTYEAANIGARALGGPVAAGMPYIVGERGPELMVPKTAGTIVPNDKMGGTTIQNNITIAAPRGTVSESTQGQVANRVGQATARAMRKYS